MTEKDKAATASRTKKAAAKIERVESEVVVQEAPVTIQPTTSPVASNQQLEINLKELKERRISDLNKLVVLTSEQETLFRVRFGHLRIANDILLCSRLSL